MTPQRISPDLSPISKPSRALVSRLTVTRRLVTKQPSHNWGINALVAQATTMVDARITEQTPIKNKDNPKTNVKAKASHEEVVDLIRAIDVVVAIRANDKMVTKDKEEAGVKPRRTNSS